VHETDISQPSETNSEMNSAIRTAMWHGNGGAEIAIAPVLFGLAGFGLDGVLGIRPVLTVVFALIGLGGACANQYFRYTKRMERLNAEHTAAHVEKYGDGSGVAFGATEHVELPSYVLASEVDGDRESELA